MMYLLKKFVGFFVTPLAFCSLIQIAGLWLIHTDKKKWGLITCASGLALLTLLSMPAMGERLMGGLEGHKDAFRITKPQITDPSAAFVVVLSGGFHSSEHYSPATRLAPDTLRRLLDGMALCRRLPDAKLLLSGGILSGEEKPATVMAELALSLGWDPSRLLVETEGKTTAEQAIKIKEMVGSEVFFLVTSANHMPRAMAHFKAAALKPIAYPCDHLIQKPTLGLRSLVPSIYGLALSNAAIHEYVGRVYRWLGG